MRVSGACFYFYHLSPTTKAHVLVDQDQAGARDWLLWYYKALFLAFRDGDLHNTLTRGHFLLATSVQQLWLTPEEYHRGLRGSRRQRRAGGDPTLVTELVSLEVMREHIAHATGGAPVRLVCHVGLEVAAQLGGQCISSATLGAAKGPLPRV